jgi:predicted metal-binding protein
MAFETRPDDENGGGSAGSGRSDGAQVAIIVCTSCRGPDGSEKRPRPGELLADGVSAAAADTPVRVLTAECLGNCKRRLSASLVREGGWSYVFGDLSPEHAADLVAGAKLFAETSETILPWRGRPDCLKRGLVARIPPLQLCKDPS